jgi:murein DD-endopeptidase MepM/ murein hydrolase activator NlpD
MNRSARLAAQTVHRSSKMRRSARTMNTFFAAALLLLVPPSTASELRPTAREGADHAVPLFGEMIRPYDAPDDPFAAGHRGIDVAAPFGSPVRASAPGTVSFAGVVNANRTVTIDHGDGLRTSYSFLAEIKVARSQHVETGQIVGTVGDGHAANQPSHVHLSARRDGTYFDPLRIYVGTSYSDLLELIA